MLSTETPLEQGIEAGESGGVAVLTERCSRVAAQHPSARRGSEISLSMARSGSNGRSYFGDENPHACSRRVMSNSLSSLPR